MDQDINREALRRQAWLENLGPIRPYVAPEWAGKAEVNFIEGQHFDNGVTALVFEAKLATGEKVVIKAKRTFDQKYNATFVAEPYLAQLITSQAIKLDLPSIVTHAELIPQEKLPSRVGVVQDVAVVQPFVEGRKLIKVIDDESISDKEEICLSLLKQFIQHLVLLKSMGLAESDTKSESYREQDGRLVLLDNQTVEVIDSDNPIAQQIKQDHPEAINETSSGERAAKVLDKQLKIAVNNFLYSLLVGRPLLPPTRDQQVLDLATDIIQGNKRTQDRAAVTEKAAFVLVSILNPKSKVSTPELALQLVENVLQDRISDLPMQLVEASTSYVQALKELQSERPSVLNTALEEDSFYQENVQSYYPARGLIVDLDNATFNFWEDLNTALSQIEEDDPSILDKKNRLTLVRDYKAFANKYLIESMDQFRGNERPLDTAREFLRDRWALWLKTIFTGLITEEEFGSMEAEMNSDKVLQTHDDLKIYAERLIDAADQILHSSGENESGESLEHKAGRETVVPNELSAVEYHSYRVRITHAREDMAELDSIKSELVALNQTALVVELISILENIKSQVVPASIVRQIKQARKIDDLPELDIDASYYVEAKRLQDRREKDIENYLQKTKEIRAASEDKLRLKDILRELVGTEGQDFISIDRWRSLLIESILEKW